MKWTLKWTWCVEMRAGENGWVPMFGIWKVGNLVDLTRDEAVDRASKLTRRGGRYSYRVRPLRPRPAP